VTTPAARRIVTQARLYGMLARRVEFANHDTISRANRALASEPTGPLHLIDAVAVIRAGELDQLCGYAVRLLSSKGKRTTEVADVLGMLDPERIAAIWWALPKNRRPALQRDPACGYHIHKYRRDLPAAQRELEDLIEDTPTTDHGYELTAFAALLQAVK
jgi:hypothetical protein